MKYRSNHVNTCNNKQACQRMKKSSIKIISVHQTSRTVEFVFTPWERYVFRSRWWAGDAVGSGQLRLVAANTSVTDGLVVSTRLVHCIRYLRGRIHAVRNCVNWSSCLQNQSVWWERERETDTQTDTCTWYTFDVSIIAPHGSPSLSLTPALAATLQLIVYITGVGHHRVR